MTEILHTAASCCMVSIRCCAERRRLWWWCSSWSASAAELVLWLLTTCVSSEWKMGTMRHKIRNKSAHASSSNVTTDRINDVDRRLSTCLLLELSAAVTGSSCSIIGILSSFPLILYGYTRINVRNGAISCYRRHAHTVHYPHTILATAYFSTYNIVNMHV